MPGTNTHFMTPSLMDFPHTPTDTDYPMTNRPHPMRLIFTGIVALLMLGLSASQTFAQMQAPPQQVGLDQIPRIYGLHVNSASTNQLLLATTMGLYLANPSGKATRLAGVEGLTMAFSANPRKQDEYLTGGHLSKTESMGLLHSTNGGMQWRQLNKNAAGATGFHILAHSKANPAVIYGVTGTLEVSRDGGKTWGGSIDLPQNLVHFEAGAKTEGTVYAATQNGLLVSNNGGRAWNNLNLPPGVVSMVHVTPAGRIYAFVVEVGLFTAKESDLKWEVRSRDFQGRILLRMATHPKDPNILFASTVSGAVVMSRDGGRNWIGYEGSHMARPEVIASGKKLFGQYCVACHGDSGQGQHTTPGFDPKNPPPIMAPALDNSAHGWHHSDEALQHTILNGSPREGSPMVAWKNVLSTEDAASLVAYIKSLWNFRSIACQGARHMSCMRH